MLNEWEAELCGWETEANAARGLKWALYGKDGTCIDLQENCPTHADLRPDLLRLAAEAGKGAGLDWAFDGRFIKRPFAPMQTMRLDPLTSVDDALTLARAVDPGMISIRNRIMHRIAGDDVDMTALEIFTVYLRLSPVDQARINTAAAIEAAGVHR